MEKMVANIQQLKESILRLSDVMVQRISELLKDNSAILIDADIRRMDEIDDGLQKLLPQCSLPGKYPREFRSQLRKRLL
jgi:hypothetical protein